MRKLHHELKQSRAGRPRRKREMEICDALPWVALAAPEDEPEHSDSSSSSDGEPPEDPLPAPKPESKVVVLKRKLWST